MLAVQRIPEVQGHAESLTTATGHMTKIIGLLLAALAACGAAPLRLAVDGGLNLDTPRGVQRVGGLLPRDFLTQPSVVRREFRQAAAVRGHADDKANATTVAAMLRPADVDVLQEVDVRTLRADIRHRAAEACEKPIVWIVSGRSRSGTKSI